MPTAATKNDHTLLSHQAVKVLTPEQLFDSLNAVVGGFGGGGGRPSPKEKAGAGPAGPTPRDRFVQFFAGGENAKPTDYDAGIPQALRLMNNAKLNNAPGLVNELAKGGDPAKVVEKLYLMTLSRRPTAAETKKLTDYAAKHSDAKSAYADVLWALVNSSEFAPREVTMSPRCRRAACYAAPRPRQPDSSPITPVPPWTAAKS